MRGIFDPEECFAVPTETPTAARLASVPTPVGIAIAAALDGDQSVFSDPIANENYYVPNHYGTTAH